jgi:hypothetical protein
MVVNNSIVGNRWLPFSRVALTMVLIPRDACSGRIKVDAAPAQEFVVDLFLTFGLHWK